MNIAIIPARSGSKRIPDKNIQPFGSSNLLLHTLKFSLDSGVFQKIIVSSDSEYYLSMLPDSQLVYKHHRSPHLSSDNSSTLELMKELLTSPDLSPSVDDTIVLLQVTSPLRLISHLSEALELYRMTQCDYLCSVSLLKHNYLPSKLMTINNDHNLIASTTSDSSDEFFFRNGPSIYISNHSFLVNSTSLYTGQGIPYVMPPQYSIDIDHYHDLVLARLLHGSLF